MHRTPGIISVQSSKWLFIFICGFHSLYAQQADTITAQKAWLSGQQLLAQEQWTAATTAFEIADSLFAPFAPSRSQMARLAALQAMHKAGRNEELKQRLPLFLQSLSSTDSAIDIRLKCEALLLQAEISAGESESAALWLMVQNLSRDLTIKQAPWKGTLSFDLGMYYFQREQYDSAVHFFETAYKSSTKQPFLQGQIQLQWAQCLRRQGDLQKAENLCLLGLEQLKLVHGEIHGDVATGYNNLAVIQRAMNKSEEARISFERSLQIRESLFGRNSNEFAIVLNNTALEYLDDGLIDQATLYARETIAIMEQLAEPNGRFHVAAYNTLADIYQKTNELKLAETYYRKALDLHEQYFPGSPRARYYHLDLGRNALQRQEPQEAVAWFHQAMSAALPDINPHDLYDNPDKDDPSNFQTLKFLCQLKGTAWHSQFDATGDTSALSEALRLYLLADHFATKNRIEVKYQKSRMLFSQQNLSLYERAIEACQQLYQATGNRTYLDRAFILSEKSKSLTLLESLLDAQALTTSELPAHIIATEHALQDSLAFYRSALLTAWQDQNESTLADLQVRKASLDLAYETFIKQIEKDYPRYHQSKFDLNFPDPATIKDNLKANETLVEYFLGSEKIFVFVVNIHKDTLYTLERPDSLTILIGSLRELVDTFNGSKSLHEEDAIAQNRKFAHITHRLYQILVAPVEEHWLQHCIIIPDGVLNYLSFGSLLSDLPQKEEVPDHWKYLEHKYVFSYNYSATLRSQMEQKEQENNNRLLALAPSFEAEDTLFAPLYFNQPEIEAILELYPGKNLSGLDATYASWQAEAKGFEILHLATHAVVNERNPDLSFLAFSRNDQNRYALYLHELYGLDLPAEMITLSACKTNVGPFQTGEGIASLAKGCSYAGARSIVTSLWEVQDLATRKIMGNFYRYLAEGMRKDVAMSMAKRAYLKDAEGLLAHPFYWSAFVVIGSTNPIPPASRFSPESILIISLLALFVIGLILYISKKK